MSVLLPRVALAALAACALGALSGCKKEETAKPEPAATETAAQSARLPPHHPGRGAFNRPDPAVTKEYRVDVCYYGTLSLRQARDAYLASLGKDEPSLKKLPSFGAPAPAAGTPGSPGAPGTPTAPGTPAATGAPAAKPPTPPVPPAPPKPGASGAPTPGASAAVPPAPDRSREVLARLPHERNARSCASAVPIKDAPMGDVDAQLAVFAPFAVELAKDITLAQQYYLREEYKQDNMAKGKEFDKKLRDNFAKLDDMSNKLGVALDAWRKDHPANTAKMDEGEKAVRDVIEDARNILLTVAQKKVDPEGWKAMVDKFEKSSASLKTFADAHPADNWSKIMMVPVDMFSKTAKAAKPTPDKGVDSDSYLGLVTSFTTLLDSKQRAIARNARPMPTPGEAPSPNAPAPTAPAPAPQ